MSRASLSGVLGLFVLVSVMLGGVSGAQAQSRSARAMARYRAGLAELKASHYDPAIAAFKEALALKPAGAVHLAIGLAYQRKGDLPAARRSFEAVLTFASRRRHRRVRPEVLKRTRAALEQLDVLEQQAVLVLVGLSPGATVTVDGRPAKPDPSGHLRVPPGRRVLGVETQGQPPIRRVLTLSARQERRVDVSGTAQIIFSSDVSGALVSLDGRVIGPADGFTPLLVRPGPITLRVAAPGHAGQRVKVALLPGERRTLRVLLLTPDGPAGGGMGPKTLGGVVSASVAGAALITAVALTVTASGTQTDLDTASQRAHVAPESRQAVVDWIDRTRAASYAMYALAGVGAITAVTLFVLGDDPSAPSEAATVAPQFSLGPNGAHLGVRVAF